MKKLTSGIVGALTMASVASVMVLGSASMAVAQKGYQAEKGWQAEWERVKAAARKEGKVVVNIPPNPTLRKKLEEVMKNKFGIELELVLARGSRSSRRIAEEHKAGIRYFDVAILSISVVGPRLRPIGAVEPLWPYLILPEVKDPKYWWGGHIWGDKGKKYNYAPQAYMLDNVWYNSDQVKENEVTSWDDLLKPKFKGKIGLFDPRLGGAGRGIWGFIWEAKGEEYLRKLAAQKLVLGNRRPLADQLAKGKLAITIGPTYYTFRRFAKAGLPIKSFPKLREGSYVSIGNGGPVIIANPPHPNAAKVFVNWLLSREGQDVYNRAHMQASRRLDVDTKWMVKFGVRAAKDTLQVKDFHARENQSEKRNAEIRIPALKFAKKLFD